MNAEIKELTRKADGYSKKIRKALDEMSNVIVGQEHVTQRLMLSLIANGHVLLEGVPGLAKTMMVKTLSEMMRGDYTRIQFTPDLLPADIIGTKIYNHKSGSFTTKKGPIFANFILADEINRAPPKVQSALLEAMQERQVTISGDTFELKRPFLVMATQNPIETEGTYRLPEAQVDRFMFKLLIDYPKKAEEKEIIKRMTAGSVPKVKEVMSAKDILELQSFCVSIYCDEKVTEYVASIVDATRHPAELGLKVEEYLDYGASPRASIWLVLGGKAHALLNGRGYVLPEDIMAVAHDVLRHRIILSYEGEAEDMTEDSIVSSILDKVKVP